MGRQFLSCNHFRTIFNTCSSESIDMQGLSRATATLTHIDGMQKSRRTLLNYSTEKKNKKKNLKENVTRAGNIYLVPLVRLLLQRGVYLSLFLRLVTWVYVSLSLFLSLLVTTFCTMKSNMVAIVTNNSGSSVPFACSASSLARSCAHIPEAGIKTETMWFFSAWLRFSNTSKLQTCYQIMHWNLGLYTDSINLTEKCWEREKERGIEGYISLSCMRWIQVELFLHLKSVFVVVVVVMRFQIKSLSIDFCTLLGKKAGSHWKTNRKRKCQTKISKEENDSINGIGLGISKSAKVYAARH